MIRTTHIRHAMPHQFRHALLSNQFALARAEAVSHLDEYTRPRERRLTRPR